MDSTESPPSRHDVIGSARHGILIGSEAAALTVLRKCSVLDGIKSPTGGLDAQTSYLRPIVTQSISSDFLRHTVPNRGPRARADIRRALSGRRTHHDDGS